MTDLLPAAVETHGEALLDLGLLEHARPPRKESFIDLMDCSYANFPEYDAAEKQCSELLMSAEPTAPSSDVESTSSSQDRDMELPKSLRKRPKKPRHSATKALVPSVVLVVSPPKQIGLISIEERQAKIRRFLEKRSRRCWTRKVSYDCRKRVADSRLRVKGRFVSKHRLQSETAPEAEVTPMSEVLETEVDLGELLIGN